VPILAAIPAAQGESFCSAMSSTTNGSPLGFHCIVNRLSRALIIALRRGRTTYGDDAEMKPMRLPNLLTFNVLRRTTEQLTGLVCVA
jgi:hypothetical protein